MNTISPGPVWTDRLPTGRFADPEEIAALVVLLASGRVPNISGSDVVIDGGLLRTG